MLIFVEQCIPLFNEWTALLGNKKKSLFGIIQGGIYKDLRIESLENLKKISFDGYALGGLAVGETQKQMFNVQMHMINIENKNSSPKTYSHGIDFIWKRHMLVKSNHNRDFTAQHIRK